MLIAREVLGCRVVKADLLVESVPEPREDGGLIKIISRFLRKEILNFKTLIGKESKND
jgi:hypothetical protein